MRLALTVALPAYSDLRVAPASHSGAHLWVYTGSNLCSSMSHSTQIQGPRSHLLSCFLVDHLLGLPQGEGVGTQCSRWHRLPSPLLSHRPVMRHAYIPVRFHSVVSASKNNKAEKGQGVLGATPDGMIREAHSAEETWRQKPD